MEKKKVLLPVTSAGDFGMVPVELMGLLSIIFSSSAEDVVIETLGAE